MKMGNVIENVSVKLIVGLMILIMGFLTIVSILQRSYIDTNYQEIIQYRNDNVILALGFLVLLVLVVWLLQKKQFLEKIPEKPLLITMLIFVAIISGGWAYVSDCVPVADQRWILRCVDGLINGDYFCMDIKSPDGYLQYNRHQVGLTAFYELFTKVFTKGKVNHCAVYILNVLMITGIFLGLYLVTKQLTKRKDIINLELILSLGMFQLMMYSTFIYGLIPGLFFAVFGIYFMLKLFGAKKWYFGLMAALMCALSIVMKSNYMIFLIAIGGTILVKTISEKYPLYLVWLLLAVVIFSGINTTVRRVYEKRTGIEFEDTIPNTAYLAMAMQEGPSAPGWFNGFNHVTFRLNDYSEEITDQISKEYISARLTEFVEKPWECLRFYYKKVVSQWNEVTYECFWIGMNEENRTRQLTPVAEKLYFGKLHTAAEAFMNLYQLMLFFGTLLFAWSMRMKSDISQVILLLCVLGGFLFHILWEGKSQYIITYFPLLLPCTAIGLIAMLESVRTKKGNPKSDEFVER